MAVWRPYRLGPLSRCGPCPVATQRLAVLPDLGPADLLLEAAGPGDGACQPALVALGHLPWPPLAFAWVPLISHWSSGPGRPLAVAFASAAYWNRPLQGVWSASRSPFLRVSLVLCASY